MRGCKKMMICAAFAVLLSVFCTVPAFALTFNGTSSAGGDGSSTTASSGGYAVPTMLTNNSNRAVGYRFTIIDANGNTAGNSKDVYRAATKNADNRNYLTYYKPNTKYPKTYLRANYTRLSMTTSAGYTSCWWDVDVGLKLPELTTGIAGWSNDANAAKLLSKLWSISIATLENNRWAILIEPIFPIKIQGTYHSLTVTEIAFYGAAKFGSGSNGNASANSNSWGFIANYTNRYLPNSLRLTSAYVGMPATWNATSRLTFYNIMYYGYGAAMLYGSNLTKPVQYYLDVNAVLDGNMQGNLNSCGTCDVYLNGKLAANDVIDFYQKVNTGTSYSITDIKPKTHLNYNGASQRGSALTGTVTKATAVCPDFTTKSFQLDVNVVLDGEQELTLNGWCIFDIYLNGSLYKQNVSDFCEQIKYGTTYTVTNIRPAAGKSFFGAVTDLAPYPSNRYNYPRYPAGLSGTMGLENKYIFLGLETDKALEAVLLPANAPYREETEVVTSGFVLNLSNRDYIPTGNIKTELKIYSPGGKLLYADEKPAVVPKKDKNLCYFKWRVPEGLDGGDVKVRLAVKIGNNEVFHTESRYETTPYIYLTTPDTAYEAAAPVGFTKPAVPEERDGYATWWEYVYANGAFEKKVYGIGIGNSIDTLSSTLGGTAISSGRGFSADIRAAVIGVSGNLLPQTAAYTEIQYITALFPEFSYRQDANLCKTLLKSAPGHFELPNSFGYGKLHFIPLSYPDGEYRIAAEKSDLWTPAGMVSARKNSAPLTVSGSVYDEYYIGR